MVKIIEPSAELLWHTPEPEQAIASIARTCYKSEERDDKQNNVALLKRLIKSGHFAMLDHASASIKFITDRGISHEIVRHRLAGYAQESSRYCDYSRSKFGGEISVVRPCGIQERAYQIWLAQMVAAEKAYFGLLATGELPQKARAVLPTCTKTEIVMTADFTEWLHFFRLRLSPKAHPDIWVIAMKALCLLSDIAPNIFTNANCGLE